MSIQSLCLFPIQIFIFITHKKELCSHYSKCEIVGRALGWSWRFRFQALSCHLLGVILGRSLHSAEPSFLSWQREGNDTGLKDCFEASVNVFYKVKNICTLKTYFRNMSPCENDFVPLSFTKTMSQWPFLNLFLFR